MLEQMLDDNGQPFPELSQSNAPSPAVKMVPVEDVLGLISRYELWVIPKDELVAAVQELAAA
ncbi:hypothetical protein ACGYLO_10525 [Sulfitobacter sp. 1A13353]|uniref:hypothetical protein n=1 Tax=Sulfitobacter sp. 1A13353 TaxID=3368568 RepID=UPI00374746D1